MSDITEAIGLAALNTFLGSLEDSERRKVASVGTLDDLLRRVETLRASYAKSRLVKTLNRLHPVLLWFESYNNCVKIFLEAAPDPLVVLWGSLALMVEVCTGVAFFPSWALAAWAYYLFVTSELLMFPPRC
jgi:hypothetical protein